MPQETNLNVSPYFDDFDENKNFNRVLFKPGSPVQARELTQLQTILQNQLEKFGQHFFKEGTMVIPGQIGFDADYHCIELEDTFLGIPISEYLSKLVGKTIKGETSGVEATVVNHVLATKSDRGRNTLYLKYTKSGDDFVSNVFNDGENLITTTDIEYGNSRIIASNPFATTIALNAASVGTAASVEDGVYFIRGYFVKVPAQTIIVDQYKPNANGRVGLFLEENIVSAFDDASLFDNAAGFSNYAAPGADRFQLKPTLIKKDLDEFNDANFIELLRVDDGVLQEFVKKTDYNFLGDEFARRTYDESGSYYVKPFGINVREILNNRQGNNGVYYSNQKTSTGNTPDSSNMIYQVSPGKAYVKGYEIEKIGSSFIEVEKPRTTKTLSNQSFAFRKLQKVKVNRVFGSPFIGLGSNNTVSLRDQRTGSTHANAAGLDIGMARVYDYKLEAAAYAGDTSVYEVFLWDIQTFTTIVVNSGLTAGQGSLIEGARSGARGHLVSNASGATTLTLTSTSGTFQTDEPIKVNGISDTKTITSITERSFDDVKSIFQDVGDNEFNADTVLSREGSAAPAGIEYTIATNGVVSVGGNRFRSGVKIGDIVKYQKSGESDPTYNRVTAIAADGSTITVAALAQDVAGVCQKELTGSTLVTSDFKIIRPQLINANNTSLASEFPVNYISNVDLSSSEIQVRRQVTFNVSGNRATVTLTETNQYFEPFDEERYNVAYSDGSIQILREDNLQFNATFKSVTLVGLSKASDTGAILVFTSKKTDLTAQSKTLTRCKKLTLTRSRATGSGTANNTLNDGLTTNSVYGTRVQDEDICLNVPDAVRVLAIFESSTVGDPSLPSLSMVNRSLDLDNSIQGELIIGDTSGAAARVVSSTTSTVDIVHVNDLEFNVDEIATFQSSGIVAKISVVNQGDKNIVKNYQFDNGQRDEFYDYSKIIRKEGSPEPSKRLSIIFDHYIIDGDNQDFATVSSYSPDGYDVDIPYFKGSSAADYLDARPRVADYVTSSTTSPFLYTTRSFAISGTAPLPLIGDETVTLSYSHYLSRIDMIFLNKSGFFEVKKGAPAPLSDIVSPEAPAGSFLVATVFAAPYVRNGKEDTRVLIAKHKRYTMADIGRLESRLQNVEYYTQLSLLETDTATLEVTDAATGLNRFKSGFFVDNFRSHAVHAVGHPNFRSSIDVSKGQLRPTHYTHGLDLLLGSEQVIGIGTTANPSADLTQVADLQSNDLKRSGDVVTLNFEEVVCIEQKFATRTENVNPFAVITWVGGVELNPNSDVWMDETRIDANITVDDTAYKLALTTLRIDPNTGLSPIDWGAWETQWTSSSKSVIEMSKELESTEMTHRDNRRGAFRGRTPIYEDFHFVDTYKMQSEETTTIDRGMTRSGIQFSVNEKIDTQSLGDRIVNAETIPYMRSRNIEFIATRIKPRTQFYTFFDKQDITKYVTPKLIEVTMTQGVFQVGETIVGTLGEVSIQAIGVSPAITFRAAQPNHKFGSYNDPRIVYAVNPYSDDVGISSSYSATSSIVNVDTGSLQVQVLGEFNGYVAKGMTLVGKTSGAEAKISDVRLITDEKGALLGSLFVPNSNSTSAPAFQTGTKVFRLTSSSVDSRNPADRASTAESTFTASGTLNTLQEEILSVRTADIQTTTVNDETVMSETVVQAVETTSFVRRKETRVVGWYDPLAESIEIADDNGIFASSVDIFFHTKDTSAPVTLQLRTMKSGLPTTRVLPFGEVVLDPEEVNLSDDGSVATTFTFPSPVYLEGGKTEYAIVLLAQSTDYNVFISRMGDEDLADKDLEESERRIVSQQPYMGSLFKSQNGSTWDASQFEDLKFALRKCQFVPGPGALRLYNPELGVGDIERPKLRSNPLTFNSQEIKIQLQGNSSTNTNTWPVGSRLTQVSNTSAEGNVVAHLGSLATHTYQSGTGIGLTPASGNFTFGGQNHSGDSVTGIALTSITGDGSGARAQIRIESGAVGSGITVSTAGSGYKVGDVLGATLGETGRNVRFSVASVTGTNSVILNNVQGAFNTTGLLQAIAANGSKTSLNNGVPTSITNTAASKDGLHVYINHRNHGMHAANNKVKISGAVGVGTVATLSENYANNATSAIKVDDASFLTSFEGLAVSTTNPGYVQIGNEVIKYTATNTGTTPEQLTGITRAIDGTIAETYDAGKRVRKYETAGISLRRINTTHDFNDVDNALQPNIDGYYIKIDTTQNSGIGTQRDGLNSTTVLKIAKNEVGGGDVVRGTQNIQFEAVTPNVEFMTPVDTGLYGRIRTVSATSASGSETSFEDQGFEIVSLNGTNYLDTPRIIASKVNEDQHCTSLPGNKSFTQEVVLSTRDTNVSPVIDLDRLSVVTTTNRLDQRVSDYKVEPRVNSQFNDPNAAIYITKQVALENPATSLQVRFAAYRHSSNDIRVLYRLLRNDSVVSEIPFELFPGYKNLTDTTGDGYGDELISAANNDGSPDARVPASSSIDDFNDYRFTANDLTEFHGFQIKVIMTGTNQAKVPRIRDFRAIALA